MGKSQKKTSPKKRRRTTRWFALPFLLLATLILSAALWKASTEPLAHWTPPYDREDLLPVYNKKALSAEDYRFLLMQTGLAPPVVDTLRQAGNFGAFETAQQAIFTQPRYSCVPNSPISWEEELVAPIGGGPRGGTIFGLEDGDILITKSSHVYGWRNGHAALVVDAENGVTLESVVLGTNSCTQNLNKWTTFPNFMVLRVKDMDKQTRAEVAAWAMEHLNGVAYDFSMGVLRPKEQEDGNYIGTQCSHLVWAAYKAFGYDLDADGGMIVTPKDLANSPLLEVVQVYGVDPSAIWP